MTARDRCRDVPRWAETHREPEGCDLPDDVVDQLAALGIRHVTDGEPSPLRYTHARYFRRGADERGLEPIEHVLERLRARCPRLGLDPSGAVYAPDAEAEVKLQLGELYRERRIEWLAALNNVAHVAHVRAPHDPATSWTLQRVATPSTECAPQAAERWIDGAYWPMGRCYESPVELASVAEKARAQRQVAHDRSRLSLAEASDPRLPVDHR